MQTTTIKIILLLVALALTACAGQQHVSGIYLAPDLSDSAIAAMAGDMTRLIADGNPAKNTGFVLPQDRFGRALADRLGKAGYETAFIGQPVPENAAMIRYTIDRIDRHRLYVALSVNNSQRYIRSYTEDHGNLIPAQTTIKGRNDE